MGCLGCVYRKADSEVGDLVCAPLAYSRGVGMQDGVNGAENCAGCCVTGPAAMQGTTMALYLSQECWGRVCLHFVAALRAGHWGWHLAGIGREIGWCARRYCKV